MKPLPLIDQDRVVEDPADRNTLTQRYTQRAVAFLEKHRSRPFFLYLAHAMPGSTPRPFASEGFQGRSKRGAWGDAVEELDWSTGEIVAALRRLGLERDTVVVWTNDNGAPRVDGRSGSNRPLGGWGYTIAEGGQRVPCIAWAPGRIPAGRTCGELVTLMDWLPTFAGLTGARTGKFAIDGRDLGPLLAGKKGARPPHEAFFYYYGPQLQAVRSGRWKLVLPLAQRMANLQGKLEPGGPGRLYDVVADPGETADRFPGEPTVVARLSALAEKARAELGDLDRRGSGQRPAGRR